MRVIILFEFLLNQSIALWMFCRKSFGSKMIRRCLVWQNSRNDNSDNRWRARCRNSFRRFCGRLLHLIVLDRKPKMLKRSWAIDWRHSFFSLNFVFEWNYFFLKFWCKFPANRINIFLSFVFSVNALWQWGDYWPSCWIIFTGPISRWLRAETTGKSSASTWSNGWSTALDYELTFK